MMQLNYYWPPQTNYKIGISTSLHLMGKQMSENKTESLWRIDHDSTRNVVQIDVLDKKTIQIDGQIKPLIQVIDKINKTTDTLKLQLDNHRSIARVLDIPSILHTWENIRFRELKHLELQDASMKAMFDAYESEFHHLTNSIQTNILYQLLFYPQGLIKYPVAEYQHLGGKKKIISRFEVVSKPRTQTVS